MKKPQVATGSGAGRHCAPIESEVLREHLPLVEHCCMTQYDDGSPRVPGWFTVRTQGRAWIIDVKNPETLLSFRVLAESLDEALETAALLLAAEEAPWEPDPWLKSRSRTKKA